MTIAAFWMCGTCRRSGCFPSC